jgi:hypothetical protein
VETLIPRVLPEVGLGVDAVIDTGLIENMRAIDQPYLPKPREAGVNSRPESRTRFHARGSRLAFTEGNALEDARELSLLTCVAGLELALTPLRAKSMMGRLVPRSL